MARKKHEEHENHERWLVSYADFITLLFAFFVVMYSTSSVNEGKMRVLSDSLVAAFAARNKSLEPIQIGELVRSPYSDDISLATSPDYIVVTPPDARQMLGDRPTADDEGFIGGDLAEDVGAGTGEGDQESAGPTLRRRGNGDGVAELAGAAEGLGGNEVGDGDGYGDGDGDGDGEDTPPIDEPTDLSAVAASIKAALSPLFESGAVRIRTTPNWLEVEIKTRVLFVSGSARLAHSAVPIMTDLARLLRSFPNPVQVEGFTDDIPIRTLAYPSNWELSAARAASVVHLLMKNGVEPTRMSAVGYGEFRPVADNRTPEGRAKNRRVVIIIPADEKVRRLLDLDRLAFTGQDG